jgi:hypothetical protein
MRGCTLDAPCAMARDSTCVFAEPSSWMVFRTPVGEAQITEPGFATELYAFPGKHAGKIEPVRISDGAYDSEFVLTWTQEWSPDGDFFVFDASTAHVNAEPESDTRVFVTEFGAGMPAVARRVVGLPEGMQLVVDSWDPTSSGFTVRSSEPMPFSIFDNTVGEVYLVRREGNELEPSLIAPLSERVDEAVPCAGAEHVVYTTSEGELVIRPATGAVDTFRLNADFEEIVVSHDHQWLALSTIEGEHYELSILPCGEGPRTVLWDNLEQPAGAEFSSNSRYVALLYGDTRPVYFEPTDLGSPRPFPDDVFDFYVWAPDETFGLVANDAGELLAFWPESGETELVRADFNTFQPFGNLLVFDEVDDEDHVIGFEVLHPRQPEEILARVSASEGTRIETVLVDEAGSQLAFSEVDDDSVRVIVLELGTGREKVRFEFEGALDFTLDSFAPDGSGLFAWDDSGDISVYFLPADGEQQEPILIRRPAFPEFLGAQPRP